MKSMTAKLLRETKTLRYLRQWATEYPKRARSLVRQLRLRPDGPGFYCMPLEKPVNEPLSDECIEEIRARGRRTGYSIPGLRRGPGRRRLDGNIK